MNMDANKEGVLGVASGGSDRRSVLQGAVAALEKMQHKLDALEYAKREPIAIVGMACKLPGGLNDPDAYWHALAEGRDMVTEVPPDRWNVEEYFDPTGARIGTANTKSGGFVDDIFMFEPAMFGMSPREAAGVDPQQRMLLESSWEALESAGIAPDSLTGSLTGVFVGICTVDYSHRVDVKDPLRSDVYLATGNALNAAAGRVSFTLGLQGPCMAVDTACSSSLVAIHNACQSLRNGESDLALAGGVNALLVPFSFVLLSKWGMLSPDGRCKAFDASANGFVRAEGCVVFVLERLSDALSKGHQVLALIRGSAINQDGRSSGLTVPNGIAQQAVIRRALQAAGVAATDVSYVEAHGTGTGLGDPIEGEAIATVYGEGRDVGNSFEIGSAKSNIGHLEAASGAAGLAKLVLSMRHRKIPASLHVTQPTPALDWQSLPMKISTRLHDWNPPGGKRLGAVSAFGFSGMNAHVIVEEAPPQVADTVDDRGAFHCLPLSARNEAGLLAMADRYARHVEENPGQQMSDICRTAAIGRARLPHRLAIVASGRDDLIAQLRSAATGEGSSPRGVAPVDGRVRVAFLFTGQGSQYVGMGRDLYAGEPVFRAMIDRCALVLDPQLVRPLRDILFTDSGAPLEKTGETQPALFALQVALAALWRSWGVEPTAVIGHSVGEFAAATVAGVLSVEDGARLVAARGRLMQALPAGGVMLAVQGNADQVEEAVAATQGRVSVAARNAPGQLVLAGTEVDVAILADRLQAAGMRVQRLVVSHAFHSELMLPMIAEFQRVAAQVPHNAPTLPWISNLSGAALDWPHWSGRMDQYWARHVRDTVAFERGVRSLQALNCAAYLEIGPHPVLLGMARQTLGDADQPAWVPSLKRGESEGRQIRSALAMLFVKGLSIDWGAVYGDAGRRVVTLPTYPFQKERYLIPPREESRRVHQGPHVHELLGIRLPMAGESSVFEREVNASNPAWLADHTVASEVLFPLTAFLEIARAAAWQVVGGESVAVENVEISAPLMLRAGDKRVMQTVVDSEMPAASRVRIFSRDSEGEDGNWQMHMQCTIRQCGSSADTLPAQIRAVPVAECTAEVDVPSFYDYLRGVGVDFGPAFRGLSRARLGSAEALGEISLEASVAGGAGEYFMHPALLDACFHVSAVVMRSLPGGDDGRLYLPVGVDRYCLHAPPDQDLVSYARVRERGVLGDMLHIDMRIESMDGRLIATLEGLRCRRASKSMFRERENAQVADWCYRRVWKEQRLAESAQDSQGAPWLVLDDGNGHGEHFTRELSSRGISVVRVVPGSACREISPGQLEIDASNPEDYTRVLAGSRWGGIVSFWPLRLPTISPGDVPGDGQGFGSDAALLLFQAFASAGLRDSRLCIVTRGSQAVDGSECVSLEQAPVAGLMRVVMAERPDLRSMAVDLDPECAPHVAVAALVDELLSEGLEPMVAFRKGQRHVERLARVAGFAADPVAKSHRLTISEKGTLENLVIIPAERRMPGPGEVEIRVRASGLNFRDVLYALGMYPGDIPLLGSDCAGEVVAIGSDVTRFAVGDRVVAMVQGAFASHATTRWEFVAPLPANLSFEQGAAVPTAYLTADITLNLIARMKKGDKVLIHSGAGGVGMAAIALARKVGAEVFATAGNLEKRAVITSLGASHALDSRSTSFADEILRLTDGQGVDIVLNSLAGDMLDRSFDVLRDGGTFLEIGKRGVWSRERVEGLGRGINYHIVDCNDNARETPQLVGEIFTRVLKDIDSGALPVLPCTTFSFERAVDAFRFMAQARHIGRVVFRHSYAMSDADEPVSSDRSYVVTGGLRGIGLMAARWLADEGARDLVLIGRSAPDDASEAEMALLRAQGVSVHVLLEDVGTVAGVRRIAEVLRSRSPLGGLIHCAGILDDGMLESQTAERFRSVMKPKADGAWLLHNMLDAEGHDPEFFILYSSMAVVMGSPGQGNYVAANAFQDALANYRNSHGRSALSIGWGPWAEVGMAARGSVNARSEARGMSSLTIAQGLSALGVLVRSRTRGCVAVGPFEWDVVAASLDDARVPPLLSDVIEGAKRRKTAGSRSGSAPDRDYSAIAPKARRSALVALVQREVAFVLGLGDAGSSVPLDQEFSSLGLDSLTSVELKNRLQAAVGRQLSATATFDWPTIGALGTHLAELFQPEGAAADAEADEDREEIVL